MRRPTFKLLHCSARPATVGLLPPNERVIGRPRLGLGSGGRKKPTPPLLNRGESERERCLVAESSNATPATSNARALLPRRWDWDERLRIINWASTRCFTCVTAAGRSSISTMATAGVGKGGGNKGAAVGWMPRADTSHIDTLNATDTPRDAQRQPLRQPHLLRPVSLYRQLERGCQPRAVFLSSRRARCS